jgi:group I intron endonuclease
MVVYKITNKITNESYIGQTVQSLKKRWNSHCSIKSGNKCTYIYRAIQKYGKENFEISIITRCNSIEEMNHREAYYIKLFNTLAPDGYNLDSGGKNKRTHQDTKDKISKIHKGKPKPPPSRETRDKIAKANIGKKYSDEVKQKHSIAWKSERNPNIGGKAMTKKQIQMLIERSTGRPSPMRKPVLCITTGVSYPFLMKAAEELGIDFRMIARVCSGERTQTHGLKFKYLD